MKRAEALRPLSREHLVALLAAKKLREAGDLEEATRVFLDFWHGDGQRHFRIEEEVLLPTWAMHAEVDRDGVARMLDEHLAIRREALRLEEGEATLGRGPRAGPAPSRSRSLRGAPALPDRRSRTRPRQPRSPGHGHRGGRGK